jgi:hypothetical protein
VRLCFSAKELSRRTGSSGRAPLRWTNLSSGSITSSAGDALLLFKAQARLGVLKVTEQRSCAYAGLGFRRAAWRFRVSSTAEATGVRRRHRSWPRAVTRRAAVHPMQQHLSARAREHALP